jgi:hypothetical protein
MTGAPSFDSTESSAKEVVQAPTDKPVSRQVLHLLVTGAHMVHQQLPACRSCLELQTINPAARATGKNAMVKQ